MKIRINEFLKNSKQR
ncbi:hypothetical protein [Plasmodium yoelii yoelii]|uniref:Uncharacterized protein n=1 Tax=Plasmodium yoelii yoelii TaxID=73239 RepID=Q7RSI6_PLAYO|nr:hypothetical protein [Plasmodium yoelii yoelii]